MAGLTSRLRRKLKTNDVLSIIAASNGSDDDGDTPVSVTSSDGWEHVPLEDLIGREIENEEFTPVEIGLQSIDGLSSVVGQALQTIVGQTSDDDILSEKTYGDDSDGDPDFKLTDESSTSSHTEEETEVNLVKDSKIVKRHKRPAELTWKMNVPKHKRLSGEMYTNRKDEDKPERVIGTSCSSGYCSKSKFRDCQSMSEDERLWVFNKFWSMNSWEERKLYVETLVTKVAIKQKKSGLQSRRNCSYIYQLQIEDGTKYNVCKRLFSSTLGIPERTIFLWVDGSQLKENKAMKTPKTGPKTPVSDSDLDFVKEWLSHLPHVPSHYCRNTSTYENKKFLYPGTSIANLHREYHKVAESHSMRVISMTMFNEVFHKENFSVFIPRKDQCNVCISYNHGNIARDVYDAHIDAKNLARVEKNSDKEAANNKKSVWTVDLQAVLLCPKTKAGAMFYKTKLQVHNFTFFNLQTRDGYCYVWDESEGDLRSDVFARLQYVHFQNVIDNNGMLEMK